MLKKLLTLLVCAFSLSAGIHAQGTLFGTVTDTDGETVPGANIVLVELNRGVPSDSDGEYRITNVPAGTYTMTVTFIGYTTYTQTVQVQSGQEQRVDVVLEFGAVGLDELVVSGYAVTTKRELTGSISSVSATEIENVSLQNAQSILQGRAAGVTIATTSGNPGGAFSVQIRGNGSINAASEPLYIVDGVQIELSNTSGLTSTTPLNAINPADIESIEVLKDAAASAIYGAQAAAGVVIITTKRGTKGTSQVNASYERGVRSLARNVNYISSEEYVDYLTDADARAAGVSLDSDLTAFRQDVYDDLLEAYFTDQMEGYDVNNPQLANFDWQDFIFSEGVTEKYNMSVSGGNQATNYYISGGFEDTEGTAYNTDFTRLSLRLNIDHKINEKFLTSVTANLARSTQFGVCQDGNFVNCPVSQAMFTPPMAFPFFADGSYNPAGGLFNRVDWNPAVIRDEVERNATVNQIFADASLTYLVNDWLNVRGSLSVDYRNTQDEQVSSAVAAPVQNGLITFVSRDVENVQARVVANGRYTFDRVHNVSGLVGTEYKNVYSELYNTRGDNISSSFFRILDATATPAAVGGNNTEYVVASYFMNAKYNFDEKYFFNFTGRYDGNSRFGADVRWAFFPSFSAAWNIAEEDFFTVDFIDDLKLRAGYGVTGNSSIGNFESQALFSLANTYNGSTGITPNQLANSNLTWEEAKELNLGLDFAMLSNRVSGSIDVYRKNNDELLFDRPLPGDSGFGEIRQNIGSLRNEGIEFEVSTVNVDNRDFIWSSRFNVAFQRNEIMELPEGKDIDPTSQFQSLIIGRQLGLIQAPRWAGVNPADGRPMWYDANGEITYAPEDSDHVEYKDGQPDAVGGLGNTLSYKGFTLDAFLQFSFGQWAFASTDYFFTRTPDFGMALVDEVNDRWRMPGDVTYYPYAVNGGTAYPETNNYRTEVGTQAIYNASYIRLKNVSLSYNLPSEFLDGLGIRNVRLYASAVNMLTWTAWPWYDPEVAFNTTDIYTNQTTASYPTERQVYGGIDISF